MEIVQNEAGIVGLSTCPPTVKWVDSLRLNDSSLTQRRCLSFHGGRLVWDTGDNDVVDSTTLVKPVQWMRYPKNYLKWVRHSKGNEFEGISSARNVMPRSMKSIFAGYTGSWMTLNEPFLSLQYSKYHCCPDARPDKQVEISFTILGHAQ